MDYEQGKAMLDSHCCAQCGAPLTLTWDGQLNDYRLLCGDDKSHQGYKSIGSVTQEVARGQADKVGGPGTQEDVEKQLAKPGHPLSMLPTKDLATGAVIASEKLRILERWAESLALWPWLGHVCLYHGKPYVTVDGYYYLLKKRAAELKIGTRPLTTEERKEYQVPAKAHAWLAEAWQAGTKLPTTGLGIVTQEEIEGKSEHNPEQYRYPVVHDHPQRMAEKRAEWALLRKLVPLEEK